MHLFSDPFLTPFLLHQQQRRAGISFANPPHTRPQASKSQRPASAPRAQSSEPCTQPFEPRLQSKMPCGFRPLASSTRLQGSPARQIAPAPASKGSSAKLRASRAEPRSLARKQKRPEGGVPQATRRAPNLARKAKSSDSEAFPSVGKGSMPAAHSWLVSPAGMIAAMRTSPQLDS